MKLYKKFPAFNPYFFNGEQLQKVVFYSKETKKIIISLKWISTWGLNNTADNLQLNCEEVKNKRKLTFDGSSFLIGKKGEKSIYLPIEDYSPKDGKITLTADFYECRKNQEGKAEFSEIREAKEILIENL
jgi:hypothetical protein